jgi:translation initiation factor IF-2
MQIDSNILNSLVTFLVGFVALYVYQKGRTDKKKDAARTIVLELKNARQHLQTAKESIIKDGLIKEDLIVLNSSQWEKHKYLFARDLKTDELAEINLFYEKCALYDEIVKYNNTFFVKNEEQIRANLQAALADYTKSYLSELSNSQPNQEEEITKNYKTLLEAFAISFMNEVSSSGSRYFYRPQKTISDAEAIIHIVNINITDTGAYNKLQDISTQTLRTRILDWISRDKERI